MASTSRSPRLASPAPLSSSPTSVAFPTTSSSPEPDDSRASSSAASAAATVKPFSRSAAKRESVMMLGSIEHLRYYFHKNGLTSQAPMNPKLKLGKPAVGAGLSLQIDPSTTTLPSSSPGPRRNPLPPSTPLAPIAPPSIFDKPHERSTHIEPGVLLPGLVDDLEDVERAWQETKGNIDVLEMLKKSTKAVRSVRNYILSLPSESAGVIKAEYWSKHLLPPPSTRKEGGSRAAAVEEDPLKLVRAWALKVLESLRLLEGRARLPVTHPAYDEENLQPNRAATLSVSPLSTPHTNPAALPSSPSPTPTPLSFSLMKVQVGGREESVPVWEEFEQDGWSDDEDATEQSRAAASFWDSQLQLSSGWLYRADLTLGDVPKEREILGAYLDVVDRVLFHNTADAEERGWTKEGKRLKKRPRKSASYDGQMEAFVFPQRRGGDEGVIREEDEDEEFESVEKTEDELPDWAKRASFTDDPCGRAHALLTALLPSFASALPTARSELLEQLSSGQLLCYAYNAGVRRSRGPWGYINKESVHDLRKIEAGDKGWTFRRTDNLRLWVGGLMLRYTVPVQANSAALSPTRSAFAMTSTASYSAPPPPVIFDAKIVAAKGDGWEAMLEGLVAEWVERVVAEERRS